MLLTWLLGKGWAGLGWDRMKAAADCSRAGSHDVHQRGRGSTGVHHSQQPFCHLEGMLGLGAATGLRQGSWKPCALAVSWAFLEAPQHCFLLYPGSPPATHSHLSCLPRQCLARHHFPCKHSSSPSGLRTTL